MAKKSPPQSTPDETPQESPELATIKADLDSMKLGWQRTQADFENFRRRTREEQTYRTATEVSRALADILPIAENLRRSLAEMKLKTELSTDVEAWVSGIGQIARQLDAALAAAGITPVDPAAGAAFNRSEHGGVSHLPHPTQPADRIVHTVERGYRAGEQVLVPAKVVVSAGPTGV